MQKYLLLLLFLFSPCLAFAGTAPFFIVNMSEAVNVTGSPRIAVDVGGITRYATYTSGTGTAALTFTYNAIAGDVDLDGITVSSPIQLNGGTILDAAGNAARLTFTVPNTSNVNINYPSLGMDFVFDADGRYTLNGTTYNDLASFLIAAGGSFARASIGTYYDIAGTLQTATANVPRFDYDPVTHIAKGILMEESRTNSLLQSNAILATSPWDITTCGGITDSGATTTAPDGSTVPVYDFSTTACVLQDRAITLGNIYTHSVWIKANQVGTIGLRNPGSLSFTSTNITVGTTWQRYIVTATATQATSRFLIDNRTSNGYGITGLQLSIFGAQLEQGDFATSYIPTTTTAVTRANDTLSMPTSTWFNAPEGTFYAQTNPMTTFSTYPQIGLFGDGTSTNFIAYTLFPSNNIFEEWKQSAVTLFAMNAGIASSGVNTKFAGAYKTASSAISKDGAAPTTSAAAISSLPITLFSVGSNIARGGTDGRYSGTISVLKYYPARVANSQLQLLSQ